MKNVSDMLKRAYREEFIAQGEVMARMLLRPLPRRLWDRLCGRWGRLVRGERVMEMVVRCRG